MYLSHAVRTLRDDPAEGEDVTLLCSLAADASDETEERIARTVEAVGGTVDDHLQFETVAVTIPQTAIPELTALDGIEAIETDNTIGITSGDAGEDLDDR